MARIRTIKPDFFTSEDVVNLSPLARLLFIATWLEADREGRFVWRPRTLKLRYLPGDDCDIDCLAQELVDNGLVVLYSVEGQQYAEVPTFTKHQVINNRESESVIPARVNDATGTRESRVNDASITPLVGRERKESIRTRHVSRDDDKAFDQFWSAYPRKVAKDAALKAWNKLSPSDDLAQQIMSGLEAAITTDQWKKDEGRFIPHASTWLNGRRWEDAVSGHAQETNLFAGCR